MSPRETPRGYIPVYAVSSRMDGELEGRRSDVLRPGHELVCWIARRRKKRFGEPMSH